MNKLGRFCLVAVFLCLAVPFLAFAGSPKDITVSAAISLKNAFEEIGRLSGSQQGTKCVFNFGASGDLAKQIAGGAPVDVFAPAAQKDMDDIDKQGLIVSATRTDFAANGVVLIVPAGPAGVKISPKSFEGLRAAEIRKVAVGNPKTVPAGRYAEEVFNSFQILASIRDKLIYAENVRQVLDYVARGEVDAGVVYATDAAVRSRDVAVIAAAPETSHRPVVYPIAVVKGAKNEADAKAFISLVLSPGGKNILKKYGFR
jgi:molybdate transport system substrate-binding protein